MYGGNECSARSVCIGGGMNRRTLLRPGSTRTQLSVDAGHAVVSNGGNYQNRDGREFLVVPTLAVMGAKDEVGVDNAGQRGSKYIE